MTADDRIAIILEPLQKDFIIVNQYTADTNGKHKIIGLK